MKTLYNNRTITYPNVDKVRFRLQMFSNKIHHFFTVIPMRNFKKFEEGESPIIFSYELGHRKALLEVFIRTSAILFHLLKKILATHKRVKIILRKFDAEIHIAKGK